MKKDRKTRKRLTMHAAFHTKRILIGCICPEERMEEV